MVIPFLSFLHPFQIPLNAFPLKINNLLVSHFLSAERVYTFTKFLQPLPDQRDQDDNWYEYRIYI